MLHELWNFDEFGSDGVAASVCAVLVAVELMPESDDTGPVEPSVPSLCELLELACDAGGGWSNSGSCVHHLYVTFMGLSVSTRRSTVPLGFTSLFGNAWLPFDFRMVSWARTIHSAVIFGGLAMVSPTNYWRVLFWWVEFAFAHTQTLEHRYTWTPHSIYFTHTRTTQHYECGQHTTGVVDNQQLTIFVAVAYKMWYFVRFIWHISKRVHDGFKHLLRNVCVDGSRISDRMIGCCAVQMERAATDFFCLCSTFSTVWFTHPPHRHTHTNTKCVRNSTKCSINFSESLLQYACVRESNTI